MRESYSLLDISKIHQKGIPFFGLINEFNALPSSFLYLIKKLFKYLINNMKSYDYILNTCIMESLISLVINYFPLVFDYLCFNYFNIFQENISYINNTIKITIVANCNDTSIQK